MSKEDILLRSLINAPLTTKGTEFTFADLDGNWIELYNQLVSLSQSSFVDAYSAAITYVQNEAVMFSSQLWKMVNVAPQINITPGTNPAVWVKIYASDLVQAPLIDGAKIYEFSKTILSADVLTMGVTDTPIEIIPALGVGLAPQILGGSVTVNNVGGFPYATNTDIYIFPSTFDYVSDQRAFDVADVLQATIVQSLPFTPFVPIYSDSVDELPTNTNWQIAVKSGNPTGGSSDIIVKGTYKIIDLN